MGKGWFYGKGRNGGEKKLGGNKWEKIKMFLVATNVVASRPPERLPTGTPTTCDKIMVKIEVQYHCCQQII